MQSESSRSLDSPRLLLYLHGVDENQPIYQQRTAQRFGKSPTVDEGSLTFCLCTKDSQFLRIKWHENITFNAMWDDERRTYHKHPRRVWFWGFFVVNFHSRKDLQSSFFFERLTPTWRLIKSAHCSIHPSLIEAVHQKNLSLRFPRKENLSETIL